METIPTTTGVYVIRNQQAGRSYVGQARNMRARIKAHFQALRGGRHNNKELQADWLAHGESAFSSAVLLECLPRLLADQERVYIAALGSAAYNRHSGGSGRPPLLTDEAMARINVMLDPESQEGLKSLGHGNLSAGIRAAWQMLKAIMPTKRRKNE